MLNYKSIPKLAELVGLPFTLSVMYTVYPAVYSIDMLHLQECSATASISLGVGLYEIEKQFISFCNNACR